MNAFIKSVALKIDKNTLYSDALKLFESEKVVSNYSDHNFSRHLDTQAMLVYNDPRVSEVLKSVRPAQTFKNCFQKFINFPWKEQSPVQKKLGNKIYIFPNKTASTIFCYHPSMVRVWQSLKGSPKGFRIPEKRWTFKYEINDTNDDTKMDMEKFKLPPGALWADYCDTSSDED